MRLRVVALAGVVAFASGCADDRLTAPSMVAPPPFVVEFTTDEVRIEEGERTDVFVRYRVNDLAAPVTVSVEFLFDTASEEDITLTAEPFELPAGQGLSGLVTASVSVSRDSFFGEGAEEVSLRLVSADDTDGRTSTRSATLGSPLLFVIEDSGLEPCPGLVLLASRPEWLDTEDRWVSSTLDIAWPDDAAESGFDFVGPYSHPLYDDANRPFRANFVSWNTRREAGAIHHQIGLEWPSYVADLAFSLPENGVCDEEIILVCSIGGCGPAPDS